MIVRDEAENLAACISSCAGLFDELVVVDTGSSDGTKAIAASLGAKVFDFTWCDDFAAARNAAVEKATGDYVFWMDADERLSDLSRQRLRELLDATDRWSAYSLLSVSINELGERLPPVQQVRLFPNRPTLRWSGRIHEELIADAGASLHVTDIEIDHLGYVDERTVQAKTERNLRLLGMQLADAPDDPRALFYFGGECLSAGLLDKAISSLLRAKELTDENDPWRARLIFALAMCATSLNDHALAGAAAAELSSINTDQARQLFLRLPPSIYGSIVA